MNDADRNMEELINEARKRNCNVHDYVALHLYGHVTPETRKGAKELVFSWLYGGPGRASKIFAVPSAEVMSEAAKKIFASTYAPPNVQSTSFAVQFSATRKRMLDTFAQHSTSATYKQYTIKVRGDEEYSSIFYSVPALNAQDAQVLAFALYGGFGTFKEAEPVIQDDDIELALVWTEVID
jgi:hypothetical protein